MLSLMILFGLGLCCLIYPFRRHVKEAFCFAMIFSALSLCFYGWLGGYGDWLGYQAKQKTDREAKEAIKQFKSTDDVIAKLKEAIEREPKKAEGWYLLGRLYSSQGALDKAKEAFRKAYQLDNETLKIRFAWMSALYMDNGHFISGEVKTIVDDILKEQPGQPDTLHFLAVDAYQHHHYHKANDYLQSILPSVENDPKTHDQILKMIAEVQKKIKQGV